MSEGKTEKYEDRLGCGGDSFTGHIPQVTITVPSNFTSIKNNRFGQGLGLGDTFGLVGYPAVFSVVTQRSCVTTLKTAV